MEAVTGRQPTTGQSPAIKRRSNMNLRTLAQAAALAAFAAVPSIIAFAQSSPPGSVVPAFRETIPNIPGKSIVGVVVNYPPGGKTPPHHHAASAFITAYVLSGSIRSQVDDGPVTVFQAGEASSRSRAHIIASARTPAPPNRRSCSPFSWSTPAKPS
jgi:Cupin domain